MRACLVLTVLASIGLNTAQAAENSPSTRNTAIRHTSPASFGLDTASSFSLEPAPAKEPLIRQASLTVKAPIAASKDGFSQAPLPDDELEAPSSRNSDDDARLRADFFQRNHHQVGDALAGGAGANDQRRGHGSMAAGVALAIPMN